MLKRIVAEGWLKPRGVVGFWPANAISEDIAIWTDEACEQRAATFFTLRQKMEKTNERPDMAVSDYVAPQRPDWVGGFGVTAGDNTKVVARFKAQNDDYSGIFLVSLSDRLA